MTTWNLIFDTSAAPAGPLTPNSASVGFDWTDVQGKYSTDGSGNIISASSSQGVGSYLIRPGSGPGTTTVTYGSQENSLNQRCVIKFIGASGVSAINAIFRYNQNSASANGYFLEVHPQDSTYAVYRCVNGTATRIVTSSVISGYTPGHSYTLDMQCVQTNSTTTTFTFNSLVDNTTSTTLASGGFYTDTTASLQNPSVSGFAISAQGATTINEIKYYTDLVVGGNNNATGYAVTLGATGTVGAAQNGNIAISGGTVLSSSLSIAFGTTNSGVISPNPVIINNGSTSANFTYTPANAGNETVSWTYSGGNGGMTGNGNQIETISSNVVPATGYTVTLGTTGTSGSGQSGSITITGGTGLTASLLVSFSTTNGGTISPNPVVINSGSTTANFTYTPTNAGNETVSWSYSGGNGGMTGNGNQIETITAMSTTVGVQDTNIFWTDNWYMSSTYSYANNTGAYLKVAFTGSVFKVNFNVNNLIASNVTSSEWPVIRYIVDSKNPVDYQLTNPGGNTLTLDLSASLIGSGVHTVYIILRSQTQAFNRWTPNSSGFPPSGLCISNFTVGNGNTTVGLLGTSLAVKPNKIYFFGDSITEGSKTSFPASAIYEDAEAAWCHAVADALNAEWTNYAFSGQAYVGQLGVPDVPLFPSAWNLRFSGVTKLSSGSFITNSVGQPNYIVVNMGTNDAGTNGSPTTNIVKNLLTSIKNAAHSTKMVLVVPFAYYGNYFITSGWNPFLKNEYANYLATDSNAIQVDLGPSAGIGIDLYPAQGSSSVYSTDQLHPGGPRSLLLGTKIAQQITASISTNATAPVQVFYKVGL